MTINLSNQDMEQLKQIAGDLGVEINYWHSHHVNIHSHSTKETTLCITPDTWFVDLIRAIVKKMEGSG